MAAGALSSKQVQRSNGLRRIQMKHDLMQVADLLEIAFQSELQMGGQSLIRELRILSRSGPFLWLLAGLDRAVQGLINGYVWAIDEQIVGNVSMYPSPVDDSWIIANVAVHPVYRRRGIARELMEAALQDAERRRVKKLYLQVAANNDGAHRLYEQLGFKALRTFTRWRRRPYLGMPEPLVQMPRIHFRSRGEWQAQLQLAELVRPNSRGGIGWLQPTRASFFRKPWWQNLTSFLDFNQTYHWVIRDDTDRHLLSTMRIMLGIGQVYARGDLLTDPTAQGQLEKPMINYAVRFLKDRNKGLYIEHPSDDMKANMVFKEYGFQALHELVHMERIC